MKFDRNDIQLLDILIDKINSISNNIVIDEKTNIETIYQYIDKKDLLEFLSVLLKLKKNNINTIRKSIYPNNKKVNISMKNSIKTYSISEILNIFNSLSDEEIIQKYKLKELSIMYYTLYCEKPAKNKSKQEIISIIKNYIYISNRAKAFN